jgi:hypothetical protein
MGDGSREQLYSDLQEFGALAVTMKTDDIVTLLGLPRNRAERLKSWVSRFGSLDPRRKGTHVPAARKRGTTGGERWLVVGDVHVAPGQSYARLRWLARMAKVLKVDKIIQGGDWSSFDSLCRHRPLQERVKDSLKDELHANELSVREFEEEAPDIEKVVLGGNHDARPDDLARDAPWLDGVFDVWEHHRKAGWRVVPFLEPYESEGWSFTHYLQGRGTAKPISGMYHAKRNLERVKFQHSVVTFHSHRLQWWRESTRDRTVHGLVAGCYLEHREDYAGMDNDEWWSGAIVFNNVTNGDADLEFWSIDRIRAEFS